MMKDRPVPTGLAPRPLAIAALTLALCAQPLWSAQPRVLEPSPGPIDKPLHVVAADFDRDGFDDLAIANFQAGTLLILINQCDGTSFCGGHFVQHPRSPELTGGASFITPTGAPLHLSVVDFNPEDVDSDQILNVNDSCPNVSNPIDPLTGLQTDSDGNGVGDACEVEDTDGDGVPDLEIDSDGDGVVDYDLTTFALDNCPFIPNPGQEDMEIGAGPDCMCNTLATPSLDDRSDLYGADGICGTVDDFGMDLMCGTPDDLIGDRVGDACAASPDLVITGNSLGGGSLLGIIRVRVNDGSGGLDSRASKQTSVGPAETVLADFTGDGHPDLVVPNSGTDAVQYFPGLGDGTFESQQVLESGGGPAGVAAGDFDGDGDVDLAIANRNDNTVAFYFNDNGQIPAMPDPATLSTTFQPTFLITGDLGGDASADLIVIGQDAGSQGIIQVFHGPGPAMTEVQLPTIKMGAGHFPRRSVLADIDGGPLDLVVTDFTGGQVIIYPGLAGGTFDDAGAVTVGGFSGPVAVVPIDFDGDMDLDLAVLGFEDNRLDLLRNDGALSFTPAEGSPLSPNRRPTGVEMFGVDFSAGNDIVLLGPGGICSLASDTICSADADCLPVAGGVCVPETPRLETISNIGNNFFRALRFLELEDLANPSAMIAADFRLDNRPDLAILDAPGASSTALTVVTNEITFEFKQRDTLTVAAETTSMAAGSLVVDFAHLGSSDFDRDGVINVEDNCPTIYNPPGCSADDPLCRVTFCSLTTTTPCSVPADCPLMGETCGVPCGTQDLSCAATDPVSGQCDSDMNGIGDHCQSLDENCLTIDSDLDLDPDYSEAFILDYDRDGIDNAVDNCPTVANTDQADADMDMHGDACTGAFVDDDGDTVPDLWPGIGFCSLTTTTPCFVDADCPGIETCITIDNCPAIFNPGQDDSNTDFLGDVCARQIALDNCPFLFNSDQSDGRVCNVTFTRVCTTDADCPGVEICMSVPKDLVGDICQNITQDLATLTTPPSPDPGKLSLLTSDGSGRLFPFMPMTMLPTFTNPTAASIGKYSLDCPLFQGCSEKLTNDIVIANVDAPDDTLTLLVGDGSGEFATMFCSVTTTTACFIAADCPATEMCNVPGGTVPTQGDPDRLESDPAHPVCEVVTFSASQPDIGLRFPKTDMGTLLAVGQPATSSVGLFLVSNNTANPTNGLVPPPAQPVPLPVNGPLADLAFADLNSDGLKDLLVLSSGDGNPATPNLLLYFGIGNGLFFTDSTLNPDSVPDGATGLATAQIDFLAGNSRLDVVVFNGDDRQPLVLINTLDHRADIDGSGRVDGYDLSIFAGAFGASRGENFLLQPDGTLAQTGTGSGAVLDFEPDVANLPGGLNLPISTSPCNAVMDPLSGPYGLPVDINLDGEVDGIDLALLASLFGQSF